MIFWENSSATSKPSKFQIVKDKSSAPISSYRKSNVISQKLRESPAKRAIVKLQRAHKGLVLVLDYQVAACRITDPVLSEAQDSDLPHDLRDRFAIDGDPDRRPVRSSAEVFTAG
jgi:hypothetical protein